LGCEFIRCHSHKQFGQHLLRGFCDRPGSLKNPYGPPQAPPGISGHGQSHRQNYGVHVEQRSADRIGSAQGRDQKTRRDCAQHGAQLRPVARRFCDERQR